MSSDDSDDDLLANLLGCAEVDEPKPAPVVSSGQLSPNTLKDLDFNFLDENFTNFADETPKTQKDSVSLVEDPLNSSDDEDKKYFEKQSYSDYGKEIKQILKSKENGSSNTDYSFKRTNNFSSPSNNINKSNSGLRSTLSISSEESINRLIDSSSNSSTPLKNGNSNSKISNSPLSSNFNKLLEKSDKSNLQAVASPKNSTHKDVYSDPIFGLRIIRPLVSSAELVERMQGRKAVTVSKVKLHLTSQNLENTNEDWVIAGVILNKSATKTSQKGSQYCIWKLTDLSTDMKTVSLFLFNSAYKNFWKVSAGTVVGVLNPSVLECRDDKDLATLSIDNAQKIMILGTSKDLGKCKSMKKNGEPCTAPINLSFCEYCIYHVKQEYGKYSRRSELQTATPRRSFGPATNGPQQKSSIFQQRHPEALPFIAIPAKRNEAQYKKDCQRLALLRGDTSAIENYNLQPKTMPTTKVKSAAVELSVNQAKKDFERLNKLQKWKADNNIVISPPMKEEKKPELKFSLPPPKLGRGVKGGIIDLSEPLPKSSTNKAKLNAIEWIKMNGSIKKTNPNKLRPDKEVLNEKGIKRRREEEEGNAIAESIEKKEKAIKTKFQEMMEMKSAHSDLIEKHESEETEQYFKKLEVKERMEEKMLNTFKVNCKAVRCGVCKYVAFSSSDLCKKLQHPIKVIDAVKRFFKCGDCGNRTISLDRIPTETCKRCSSSKWIKAAMMDEKRTQVAGFKLCIRGGEEKFIGSTVTDASLNLLVPESE